MKYNHREIERIARNISQMVEDEIAKSGLFYRIFFRCKRNESLKTKLLNEVDGSLKYDGQTKFVRDVIGVRVNLYFVDDLEIVTAFIKKKFKSNFLEETIDENTTTEFKPTRINLIFKIPEEFIHEFRELVSDERIDACFELQLRTVFSEGWHEVEHDLRYKCKDDWNSYHEMARNFNGILAALETHEWSIIQLFERLSYNHYKNESASAMIRTKFRIRVEDFVISSNLLDIINEDPAFLKDFFKIDRANVIQLLLYNNPYFPLTIDNLIFLVNFVFLKNNKIIDITSDGLIDDFKKLNLSFLPSRD